MHVPADPAFDDEYFAQLAAEELHKRVRSGRVIAEWRQIRPRNEALDCVILNLSACRLAGPLPAAAIAPPAAQKAPAARSQLPQKQVAERIGW